MLSRFLGEFVQDLTEPSFRTDEIPVILNARRLGKGQAETDDLWMKSCPFLCSAEHFLLLLPEQTQFQV